jgi:hypothetical protein
MWPQKPDCFYCIFVDKSPSISIAHLTSACILCDRYMKFIHFKFYQSNSSIFNLFPVALSLKHGFGDGIVLWSFTLRAESSDGTDSLNWTTEMFDDIIRIAIIITITRSGYLNTINHRGIPGTFIRQLVPQEDRDRQSAMLKQQLFHTLPWFQNKSHRLPFQSEVRHAQVQG